MFFDADNYLGLANIIIFLAIDLLIIGFILLLTGISILRALESRNEWRRIAQEDNPDKVFNKIEDKKK